MCSPVPAPSRISLIPYRCLALAPSAPHWGISTRSPPWFPAGSVVDYGGLSVLLDTYLFQRKQWGYGHPAGDVLGESLSGLDGSGGDVHRGVDTESSFTKLRGNFLCVILHRGNSS
jgi:hypothetical protein